MFSGIVFNFPLQHQVSVDLEAIRKKTERDYQSQHQKVIDSVQQPSYGVPEYNVGALASEADIKYFQDGRRWTPAEKTRAWVITGIALALLLDIGVTFAAITTGVAEIAFAAIPL